MTRRHFNFVCDGAALAASLDEGDAKVGLLIVSGGNEVRSGAFAGQAWLAANVAAKRYPVMRFDRRGTGDSEGENGGFESAGPDISAALDAFRKEAPHISRVVAFGNCDAASALALRAGSGCDALVLANPWTFDDAADESILPPPEAIRARYLAKLRNPREWVRLVKGNVDLGKLAKGMKGAVASESTPSSLAKQFTDGLRQFKGPVHILLAGRDRTAQAFAACWPKDDPRVSALPDADHAFSNVSSSHWLADNILAALHEQARQLDMG